MSVFDLIVLTILIALAFRGWMTGMIAQIVSVCSFLVSWIVASRFAFLIAPSIPAEEPWNNIGAMIVLFVITLIAVRLFHSYLEKKIKDWNLAKLNRYLGGFLGLVKGLLLCLIVTFFGVMVSETTRNVIFKSKTGNHLVRLIEKTGTFIPSDSYELLRKQFVLFKEKVNGTEIETGTLDNTSSEEKSLKTILASIPSGQEIKEKSESSLNNLISQGNSLLETTQNLKQKTDEASSLLDAIGRWWSGTDKTEKTPTSDNNDISVKTLSEKTVPPASLPNVVLPEPAVRSLETQNLPSSFQGSQNSKVDSPQNISQNLSVKTDWTPTSVSPPVSSEGVLFRRQRHSETNPLIAEQLESLRLNSPDSEPTSFAATPMSIPRSSALFRLSRQLSVNSVVSTSDRLLDSSPTQVPATLFMPKR